MKCPNCGSEMPLEYPFCPYCGAKNQAAAQHAADMEKYRSEFARTKAEVETRTKRYGANLIKAAAAVVLVILIIITAVINNNAWSFRRDLVRKQAEQHYDTVSASLRECLAAGNYAEFSAFMDHYGLSYLYDSPFSGFRRVLQAANLYLDTENAFLSLLKPDEWEDEESIADGINYRLTDFYECLEREENYSYLDSEEYPEPPEAAGAILDMQRKIELLAVTYLGLSAEDAGRLRTMTQGSRAKLVEEGVHHALEQRSQ